MILIWTHWGFGSHSSPQIAQARYSCDKCEKVFKFASGLSRHKKICDANKCQLVEGYKTEINENIVPEGFIIKELKKTNTKVV